MLGSRTLGTYFKGDFLEGIDNQDLPSLKAKGFLHKDNGFPERNNVKLIEWTLDLGKELYANFIKTGRVKTSDPDLQRMFDTLLHTLKRQEQYYQINRIDNVIRRTCLEGPAYAKWCKKSLEYGFILAHMRDKKMYEGFPEFKSFQDYVPEYLLPFWKEEVEDIRYSFIPCKKYSEKTIKEYQEALMAILPDEVDLNIDVDRFINRFATTSSLIPDTDKTTAHMYQAWKTAPQIGKFYRCKRVEIPIEPANFRDAVILEPDSLFAIEILGQKVLRILRKVKNSLMGRNNSNLKARIDYLLRVGKNESSYLRDYKKEGLARPQELLTLTLHTLEKKYPGHFKDFGLFERYSVILNRDIEGIGKQGEEVFPLRGSGLGMMNEMVTLISCAITEMAMSRIECEILPKVRKKVAVGIWNDDSAFVGKVSILKYSGKLTLLYMKI
jgi:hypothetical protein